MKLEFSGQIFEKYSNIIFNKNPSSGSRVIPCGRTDGRTDMTKLIAAFSYFGNKANKRRICWIRIVKNVRFVYINTYINYFRTSA